MYIPCNSFINLFILVYFIDYAIIIVPIFPLLPPSLHLLPSFPLTILLPLSSCPWVVHKILWLLHLLNTPLSILYLPIMLLNLLTFSPIPLPVDNLPNDLHIDDSVLVLLVCLVHFCFCFLDSVVDSCEFVVILMFLVLIFFFLNKSLWHFM